MTAKRIQLRRTRGWRMPADTVKCDRTTKWGNPFIPGKKAFGVHVRDRRHAASVYLGFACQNNRLIAEARAELVGRNLACWCRLCDLHADGRPLDEDCPYCDRCHVDTLGKIVIGKLP